MGIIKHVVYLMFIHRCTDLSSRPVSHNYATSGSVWIRCLRRTFRRHQNVACHYMHLDTCVGWESCIMLTAWWQCPLRLVSSWVP